MIKYIFSLFLLVNIFLVQAQNTEAIINKAIVSMSSMNSYEYSFKSEERFNSNFVKVSMHTKLQKNPHKIYLNNTAGPNKGKEILYVRGENNNKALINTFINVSLSPLNSLIRKGNHYTVLEVGFGKVTQILKEAKARASKEADFNNIFSLKEDVTLDGRSCYKIVITDPTFSYLDYTMKKGESLYSIAKKKNVSEQLIIEKNNSLSGFGSGSEGLVIKIPSSYAKTSVLYIDKENFHVVYQEIHDDKGLYEKYTFTNLMINPTFSSEEFTKDFSDYNF